jgi:hypothetical protein
MELHAFKWIQKALKPKEWEKILGCWVLSCGFQLAGMWHSVVGQVFADIPKDMWCIQFQGHTVQEDSTFTTRPCTWRHHNPLQLCNQSPYSTASHPRIPDSTAASFWGPPDLLVSSYRTLIYIRGFPAFDFNLSMSFLQYYILSSSSVLTLSSACNNLVFSMSFWYICILYRNNFTDVSYFLLWLSLGHCCQVDSHLNWINKCSPLFMACFVLFVCNVVAFTSLSLLAILVMNTMNVEIMICDVTQCSLVDRPTFGRNLMETSGSYIYRAYL